MLQNYNFVLSQNERQLKIIYKILNIFIPYIPGIARRRMVDKHEGIFHTIIV